MEKEMGSPSIPEEVMFEVLARLPVKSLMIFRRVCKGWLSLVDDNPVFAKSVFNTSKTCFVLSLFDQRLQRHQIFSANADGEPALHLLSIPCHTHNFLSFSNSINGLICFLANDNQVHICNPAIPQVAMLPSSPPSDKRTRNRNIRIKKIYMGYDPKARIYKVLIVHIDTSYIISRMEILTLTTRSHSWRRLEALSAYHIRDEAYHIRDEAWRADPLVNGAVHWEGINKEDKSKVVVVAFDIVKERFEVIPLPTGVTSLIHIGEHNGQLFVININQGSAEYRVWIMKDKVWVWHKSGTFIELGHMWSEPFRYSLVNDSILIHRWRDGKRSLLMKSKLGKSRVKKQSSSTIDHRIAGVAYVESIFSLKRLPH